MEKKTTLDRKIDFAVIFSVKNANPNGDPLNGNRPRTNYDGMGEVSDVCIKRKIRDRLLEKGHPIFVQSDDRKNDAYKSLHAKAACEKWLDVRSLGQLFALKKGKPKKTENEGEGENGISIGIRGPVSVQSAFSTETVSDKITSIQITKSVSGEETKDGKRSSDTMGMKHRVDQGIYSFYGSMNPQLAERTGFTYDDAVTIKEVLPMLFENDASSARPEGSMQVMKVIWWEHDSKAGKCSSAKVHGSLKVQPDGTYELASLEGVTATEIDGF